MAAQPAIAEDMEEYAVDINGIQHTLQLTEKARKERFPTAKKVQRKATAPAANKQGTGASANK